MTNSLPSLTDFSLRDLCTLLDVPGAFEIVATEDDGWTDVSLFIRAGVEWDDPSMRAAIARIETECHTSEPDRLQYFETEPRELEWESRYRVFTTCPGSEVTHDCRA